MLGPVNGRWLVSQAKGYREKVQNPPHVRNQSLNGPNWRIEAIKSYGKD